ncbi:MAG: PEGA domain-containing protein [Chitinivibrionales bacterium]|nr:PEGA domain-containing protein [Chitinivibrionales bacterium]
MINKVLKKLNESVNDSHVDYGRIEKQLMQRIQQTETHGRAAQLNVPVQEPEGMFDRVENTLFQRIQEYQEYEAPVNECVSGENELPDTLWSRCENNLTDRIEAAAQLPAWQQILKTDIILPEGRFERIEGALMKRIEHEEKVQRLVHQPFWSTVLPYFSIVGRFALTSAALVLIGFGVWRGKHYYDNSRPIETLVYQQQGTTESLNAVHTQRYASRKDASLSLVNKHGFVKLQNGAALTIDKATRSRVEYAVSMTQNTGKATIFVKKRSASELFYVATPDYRIEVTGTYFQILPGHDNHPTTQVLEGTVKVHTTSGIIGVSEGQSLVYHPASASYRVEHGGRIVPRYDIESLPTIEQLKQYRKLQVNTDIPQASVRINGRYKGVTPLLILQAPGTHTIRISKEGYRTIDTSITVTVAGKPADLAVTLTRSHLARHDETPGRQSVSLPAKPPDASIESSAEHVERIDEVAALKQQAEAALKSGSWQKALEVYQELDNHPGAGRLDKEDAAFTSALVYVQHAQDPDAAREQFLTYLALYPDGFFVGESWLRLAELELDRDTDKAIEYYLKYFRKFPNHHRIAEIQHRVGLIYLQQKKHAAAISMFKEALAGMSHNRRTLRLSLYTNLQKAYRENGDTQLAQQVWEQHLANRADRK